jgi:lipopolysaccharide O-acetyltransferase
MKTISSQIFEFAVENGCYLLAEHLFTRVATALRGLILGGRLRTQGLRIGPHSLLRGLRHLSIGKNFSAGPGLWLEAVTVYGQQTFSPRIVIGDHVSASHHVHIAATTYVEIGDNCVLGSRVLITDHNHGRYATLHDSPNIPPAVRPLAEGHRVVVGRNVLLGDAVVVMPDVTIGEGSVIGANSVVTKDIPPYTIAAGAPARVHKTFDFKTQEWIGAAQSLHATG